MKTYKHIFWDLDHTLWDFETNAFNAIVGIFKLEQLEDSLGYNAEFFYPFFAEANRGLWKLLDGGKITHEVLRENRFKQAFWGVNGHEISTAQSLKLNQHFLDLLPVGTALIPDAIEVLEYLKPKFGMSMITNGYQTVQEKKAKNAGIHHYFELFVCNDTANALKPDPIIFNHALNLLNLKASDVLMIGDNHQTDVMGALGVGMDVVHINIDGFDGSKATHQICGLKELVDLL